jgi:hypothetical protein
MDECNDAMQHSVAHPSSSNWGTTLLNKWFVENLAMMSLDDDALENVFPDGNEVSFGPFDAMIGEAVPYLREGPCDDRVEDFVFRSDERKYDDYASIGGLWFEVDLKLSHEVAVSNYHLFIGICIESRRLIIDIKEAYNKSCAHGKFAHKYSQVLEKVLQYCVTACLKLRCEQEAHGGSQEPTLLSKSATMGWIRANIDCMKVLHWHLEDVEVIKQAIFTPGEHATDSVLSKSLTGDASGQFERLVPGAILAEMLQKRQPNFKCEESISRFAFEGELGKHFPSTTEVLLGYRDQPEHSLVFSMASVHKKE